MQAAFLQFSLNLCSYPQYSTQGGGASKFHEEVHQFSEWCSFPCEEWGTGELCRCCIRSRRTARRPFFLRFPARGQKAVHGPRASGGGAPTRHMPAPPRARGAGRARGARTIGTNPGPEKQQGQHRAPGQHRPCSRAANFGGPVPGRGARRPPSGRPFNAAHTLNGGSGGSPMWGDPPRATRLPGDGPGGTRSESRKRTAPGQRRASAPPRGRGRRRRGAARLMPGVVVQRGAIAPSAARRPGGRLFMRCRASSLRIIPG